MVIIWSREEISKITLQKNREKMVAHIYITGSCCYRAEILEPCKSTIINCFNTRKHTIRPGDGTLKA